MKSVYKIIAGICVITLFVELLFISTNGIDSYIDDAQELNGETAAPAIPTYTCTSKGIHENIKNSIPSLTKKSDAFLQMYVYNHTYLVKTKINDADMVYPMRGNKGLVSCEGEIDTPVISLATLKPLDELVLRKAIYENNAVCFLGSRIDRCSLCYVTGHYMREGITLHANGAEFHFFFVHDGKNHWINLTGVLEIEFRNGEYVRDGNFNLVTKWSGGEKKIMPLTITLFWPDRPINWIHFTVQYREDDQYFRTIERIFYGNWGQQ